MSKPRAPLSLILCVAALTGCASIQPVNYQKLDSTAQLAPNPNDKSGHVPFYYSVSDADWPKYSAVMLDPVTIYAGTDQQFGDMKKEDRTALAVYMQQQFSDALKTKYAPTTAPAPNALRVHVTLTGAEPSTPVISTLTKVAPVALVVNMVQAVRDKPAAFTGSISYAVEIYDSTSNRLLRAYVTKQYPGAENIGASFGTLDAAEAGIRKGAQALLGQLADAR